MSKLDHINYGALDTAKNAFISACQETLHFAKEFGFVPDDRLGASANVFELNLKPFLKTGTDKLYITLLPEGLGSADDAKPDDLDDEEKYQFWRNIATKTIASLTNDAASSGMQTVLISLYLATAHPERLFDTSFLSGFLEGFVDGCREVGCVYFSGETPQLKNKIQAGKIDIAGSLFGLMPPGIDPIDGSRLKAGDKMVFIGSTGPDANGYTSLRNLAETELSNGYHTKLPSGTEYWKAINNPTVLLTPLVREIFQAGINPTNIEPISGHAWQKIMRSAQNLRYVVETMIEPPEIFKFVEEQSGTTPEEMIKIFNYGLGFVIFVETDEEAKQVVEIAKSKNLLAIVGGYVEEADQREVQVKPLDVFLTSESFLLKQ